MENIPKYRNLERWQFAERLFWCFASESDTWQGIEAQSTKSGKSCNDFFKIQIEKLFDECLGCREKLALLILN